MPDQFRIGRRRNCGGRAINCCARDELSPEMLIGRRLRELRQERNYSLRELAERSQLNINTLSLMENGKSSPSVSTLQQLARALEVTIATFFEAEPDHRKVIFTPRAQISQAGINGMHIGFLGQGLVNSTIQPYRIVLDPQSGSGDRMIVHTGQEFVYCLEGLIQYIVDDHVYPMEPGDSLVFEAHLPHCWKNISTQQAQILLIICPADDREEPGGHHFKQYIP
ncbi:MAG TPA: XRE family transcriptional regulator [Anaerolineaceae bacterium]